MTHPTPPPVNQPDEPSPPLPSGTGDRPGPTALPSPLPVRLGFWTLSLAVVAGLMTGLVGETALVRVPPREAKMTVMGHTFETSTPSSRQEAADATAARAYALFGAALGLALGLAGGLSRRSHRAAAVAALVGVVAGTACGGGAAIAGVLLYHRVRYAFSNDLIASLLMHGGIFAAVGLSGGLALGAALGGRPRLVRSTLGGLLGGLAGAVVFEFLGALAFPTSETGLPVASTALPRVLAPLLVAVFTALGASWFCSATERGHSGYRQV